MERSTQQRSTFEAVGWRTLPKSVSEKERLTLLETLRWMTQMEDFLTPIYYDRRRNNRGFSNSLADLLYEYRIQRYRNLSKASVRHDIIYSLLAMSGDQETSGIIPYHRKSFPELCRDIAVYLLGTKQAQALQCCGYDEDDPDVTCSWSFNWTRRKNYSINYSWMSSDSDPDGPPLYNASGNICEWWFQDYDYVLSLRALYVDKVQDVAQFSALLSEDLGRDPDPKDARTWIEMFEQYLDNHPHLSTERRSQAWRVPIADVNVNDDGRRTSDSLRAGFDQLKDKSASMEHQYDARHTYAGALSRKIGGAGNSHGSREVFITSRGYIGLSIPTVKARDQVHIIAGGHVPLILRPTGDGQFRIMSEAYVEGIMDGEAVSQDAKFEAISII